MDFSFRFKNRFDLILKQIQFFRFVYHKKNKFLDNLNQKAEIQ